MTRADVVLGLVPAGDSQAVVDALTDQGLAADDVHVSTPRSGRYRLESETELHRVWHGSTRYHLVGALVGIPAGILVVALVPAIRAAGLWGYGIGALLGAIALGVVGWGYGVIRSQPGDASPDRYVDVGEGGRWRLVTVRDQQHRYTARDVLLAHGVQVIDSERPTG